MATSRGSGRAAGGRPGGVRSGGVKPGGRVSGGRGSGQPHPIDLRVGARVRSRRNMLGMSQEKLAEALGLTFQQVQKYERGANRISASRLWYLGRVLEVPVEFFYDAGDPSVAAGFAEPPADTFNTDPLRRRETVELVDAYFAIDDTAVRRRLLDLAKVLTVGGTPPEQGPQRSTRRGRPKVRT